MHYGFNLSFRRIYSKGVIVVKLSKIRIGLTALGAAVLLLCFPAQAAVGIREGLRVCAMSVIPALLPFMVLTKFVFSAIPMRVPRFLDRWMRSAFSLSGNCAPALLCSFLGGYPVGVSVIASAYHSGSICKQEAEQALRFCNNSGPAFFIGVIGTLILKNTVLALWLYLIHIFTALLCGRLLSAASRQCYSVRRLPEKPVPSSAAFSAAIYESCTAMLQICCTVCLFSALVQLLAHLGLFTLLARLPGPLSSAQLEAFFAGFLELSGGIMRLNGVAGAFPAAAFLMGWGGLCVHMQAVSLWQAEGLRPRGYFSAKLLHGILSALLAAALASPSLPMLTLCTFCVCLCLISPAIYKKRGRKLRRDAV